ncbi:gypsy-like retrotransposase [Cucumis melo var. makuwa]|uniref:Gypsy-like retrotransposase n=1 Tax=Cucumis melo var. makuwa TaxID=1194695 RepID=A0A5A7SM79_CUCMM|nr:gypsy-like retrotransposase [Cucumis melo var. makuwa]TYK06474.1 gypsy-like retrotransposase [Cucumis melo var. makuwa]
MFCVEGANSKPKLVHEEDKDFPRPQRLVTLADFFLTRFLCDHQDENPEVMTCHAINATEEESTPPRSLEEVEESKDLSRVDRILIDNGSTANIMSKLTMRRLGILMDKFSNSKLVIQGFDQNIQRVIGGVKKVEVDSNPFSELESHFADAKFYLKKDNSPEVVLVEISLGEASMSTTKSMILMYEKTLNPLILCYVPLSRRKKGKSPYAESLKGLKVGDIEVLKESFTTPLTKITKQEIKIDLTEASLPQRQMKDGFDLKAYKLMAKAGYDFTAHTEFKSLKIYEQPKLSSTQKKLLQERHVIPMSRKGLEYKSPEPISITRKEKETWLTAII